MIRRREFLVRTAAETVARSPCSGNTTAVRVFDAPALQTAELAQEVAELAGRAIAECGRFTWVLSGGSTPRTLYECLAGTQWRERIAWERVEFFWSDERPVAPDHPDSNYGLAYRTLLSPLRIKSDRIHRMRANERDLQAAAADYEREIADTLGLAPDGRPDEFDLVLLGLGEDGHTASLFPFTPALDEGDRAVVANKVPQLQTVRLTMTHARLNRARAVFFLVHGANKAAAVAAVLTGERDTRRFPAQLIDPGEGRLEWFIDSAAATGLPAGTFATP